MKSNIFGHLASAMVLAALLAASPAFGEEADYRWVSPVAGSWSDATKWADMDGDGNGDIPPADGTALVEFQPSTAHYEIKLESDVNIKGIVVPAPEESLGNKTSGPRFKCDGKGDWTMTFGEAGYKATSFATGQDHPVPIFDCNVILACSQVWSGSFYHYDQGATLKFNKKLSTANADVIWNLAFPATFTVNDGTGFTGTLRTCSHLEFDRTADRTHPFANAAKIIFHNRVEEGGMRSYGSRRRSGFHSQGSETVEGVLSERPIELDLADDSITKDPPSGAFYFQVPAQLLGESESNTNGYHTVFRQAFEGVFASGRLFWSFGQQISACWNTAGYFGLPEIQRHYYAADNSGLVGKTTEAKLSLINALFTVAGPHVLGKDNALPVNIEYCTGRFGSYEGILAADGVTINSPITMSGSETSRTFGTIEENARAVYRGTIAKANNSALVLRAAEGARVRFEGVISGTSGVTAPVRIFGKGDVELAAANTVKSPFNVRSGRLLLAADSAVPSGQKIVVGGDVPDQIRVRVWLRSMAGLTGIDTGLTKDEAYEYELSSGSDWTFQGVTLAPGDLVFISPLPNLSYDAWKIGVFRLNEDATRLVRVSYWRFGTRVIAEEGAYAGQSGAFADNRGATLSDDGTSVKSQGYFRLGEDITDPDAAVMTSAEVTIGNAITVSTNFSAGASVIGTVFAGASAFTGAVNLNRSVTLEACKNATLTISGDFSDDGQADAVVRHPVTISGAGRILLQNDTLAGRSLTWKVGADCATVATISGEELNLDGASISIEAEEGLDSKKTYVLAENFNTRPATISTPANWHVIVRKNRLLLTAKKGLMIMLR